MNGSAQPSPSKRPRLDEPEPAAVDVRPPAPAASDDDEDEDADDWRTGRAAAPVGAKDLYLDTIRRPLLDFDFERLCSVSLSTINVYACLVCGKFFQGRGKSSHAYAHSLNEDHHVFINLETLKVYILPDGYEVNDPSLTDIKFLLAPTFTRSQLRALDTAAEPSYDLAQQPYLPGFVGLNNIKHNSFMNVVLQALLHIPSLRDYFVLHSQPGADGAAGTFERDGRSELVKRLGMLYRKFWNPRAFKAQVSPHEFLQEVSNASGRRFRITEPGDPLDFLNWLLNALHRDLGGTRKPGSSVIYAAFQGEVRVDDQAIVVKDDSLGYNERPKFDVSREIKTSRSPFLLLTIDLPPPPVFQDAIEKNFIPQVTIGAVLDKYNGVKTAESHGRLRRYKLTRLPPYIILHFKRFSVNNFVEEKNPTIVNYPLHDVDLRDYLDDPSPAVSTLYNLVANITHESMAGTAHEETVWKTHVHTRPANAGDEERWFQIQDLIVDEIQSQMVFLGETYLQIWELKTDKPIELNVGAATKKVVQSTRSLAAAAGPQKAKAPTMQPGVRMPKPKVEKGDSQAFAF